MVCCRAIGTIWVQINNIYYYSKWAEIHYYTLVVGTEYLVTISTVTLDWDPQLAREKEE